MERFKQIVNRSVDWMPIVSYALHNVFFSMAVADDASIVALYIEDKFKIDPLFIILFLMIGFIISAGVQLHWKTRVIAQFPLVVLGIVSVAVYSITQQNRAIVVIGWVYFMAAIIPIALTAVHGSNSDLLKEAKRLETLAREQNRKLIEYESRFETGKTSGAK